MGLEGGNETAGEVQGGNPGQTSAPEVASTQTPQQQMTAQGATTPAPWRTRIGDTEYDEATWKTRGVEDYRKLHGSYTQSRQELARLRDESGAGMELLQMVQGDPALKAEVQRRLQIGQSAEQAVKGAVQNDPRVDTLYKEVDSMKQEKASRDFRAKHPDLTKDDEQFVVDWITERTDKLKNAGWSYDEILDAAYNACYTKNGSSKAAAALVKGQEMKEQEIQKGRKGQLLGAPSPTAQTKKEAKGPTIKMSPAEREKVAMQKFMANKKG